MQRKVKLLPETVQNQIAAGEVVERPASVVKELVENAIDAGAKNISVDLEQGGHRLIRVADDGSGMAEDDLLMALERHATSKIENVDEIFRITTMGFRGEALPSIASVSRTSIITCMPGEAEGRQVVVEGGNTVRLVAAPTRRGTMVEVRDIFFNTPARRKFLRQPGSENTQSAAILMRLALAHPEIGFRLQADGVITLAVHPVKSQLDRIGDLFGPKFVKNLLPVSREITDGITMEGFISQPPDGLHNSTGIYILVNKRWIRHHGIAKAMSNAYQGALPPRKYPYIIINLAIDPARVDVNVHPTKEEIRFDNERLVKDGLCGAIKDALRAYASQGGEVAFSALPLDAEARKRLANPAEIQARRSGLMGPRFTPQENARPESYSQFDASLLREEIRRPQLDSLKNLQRSQSGADAEADYTLPEQDNQETAGGTSEENSLPPAAEPEANPSVVQESSFRVLGQVFDQYIMIEGRDAVHFIDPHALHERWNFDKLLEEGKRGVSANRLLIPVEIRLLPTEMSMIGEAGPVLEQFGFSLALDRPGYVLVEAAPDYLQPNEIERLIRDILADVDSAGHTIEARRERLLASLACHSSVLLGKKLPEEEIDALLDRFFHSGQMPTCPHGRPVAVTIPKDELARRFGR